MNKILLLLIIVSGFLVISYANSDIFWRKSLLGLFDATDDDDDAAAAEPFLQPLFMHNGRPSSNLTVSAVGAGGVVAEPIRRQQHAHISRVKYVPRGSNDTEYNIFVIYTKENYQLQKKFELFALSLIKFSTARLHLHIITDAKSEQSAEEILKKQIHHYRKSIVYTLYDVHESAEKITDIVRAMMPYFSSNPGSYYSDALFYLSLGLHRIVDQRMERAILIDCDVVFRSDVRLLFNEFDRFSADNLFGLAPELTPVYRHILYRYRANYPKTSFGSPYYTRSAATPSGGGGKHKHKHVKHGYPGLNSGVVMLNFKRIRDSKLYLETLKEVHVRKITNKYSFRGHLGDQDFYTLLGYEFPGLIYRLDCIWNRQLCTWWKDHGYSDVFDSYFHCEGKVKVYHGNCNTRVPERPTDY